MFLWRTAKRPFQPSGRRDRIVGGPGVIHTGVHDGQSARRHRRPHSRVAHGLERHRIPLQRDIVLGKSQRPDYTQTKQKTTQTEQELCKSVVHNSLLSTFMQVRLERADGLKERRPLKRMWPYGL